MADKETLPQLASPAEPEQPEEGFVPYAAEAAAAEKSGIKRRLRLLIPLILLGLTAVVTGTLLLMMKFNRYHTVMKNLKFDYRTEETPGSAGCFLHHSHPSRHFIRKPYHGLSTNAH